MTNERAELLLDVMNRAQDRLMTALATGLVIGFVIGVVAGWLMITIGR